jgi:hypothetical protein
LWVPHDVKSDELPQRFGYVSSPAEHKRASAAT